MKKLMSLLIGVSLGLAGVAFAQQPEGQESPVKKGGRAEKTTTEGATETKPTTGEKRGKPGPNATQPSTTTNETGVKKHERGAKSENATGAESSPGTTGTNGTEAGMRGKHGRKATTNTAAETGPSASPGASGSPMETGKKGKRDRAETARASATPAPSAAPSATMNAATSATDTTSRQKMNPGANPNVAATGAVTTHVDKEKVQVVKQQAAHTRQQYATFKAQPRPDRAPAVTFNANFRIQGSDRWSGPQYEVFRSYRPERHDRGWYSSHYQRVELIAGGYYYFNNGYWSPAWGYDPSAEYYAYDAPIYVGHSAEPPDRVIADVQAELQQMGYYEGEVDGLLGPLTRQALTAYQADQGLEVTAVIDEPTLDSLNMG